MSPRLILTLAVLVAAPALAADGEMIDALPAPVAALSECDDPALPGPTRRTFAGGVVFTARCPGNNANYIEEMLWARDADGNGAELLNFLSPDKRYGDGPKTSLSNVRWYPDLAQVRETAIDEEEDVCRSEGVWRLAGMPPKAELLYWRQTQDCTGAGGWTVLVDKGGWAKE